MHPILFPKLIWVALAFATNWSLRVDMVATLVTILVVLTFFVRFATNERSVAPDWLTRLTLFVTSILLFSFVQYDTILWGFQLSFTLVNMAVAAALYFLSTSTTGRPVRGLLLAWCCCFVASFSSLQGMLSWAVVLPSLGLLFKRGRACGLASCGTISLGAASVVVYRYVFVHPTNLIAEEFWYKHPFAASRYLLAILGAPLVGGSVPMAKQIAWLIGALALVLFVIGACWTIRTGRWAVSCPWISTGVFSIGFAAMTTIGRSAGGLNSAVTLGSPVT